MWTFRLGADVKRVALEFLWVAILGWGSPVFKVRLSAGALRMPAEATFLQAGPCRDLGSQGRNQGHAAPIVTFQNDREGWPHWPGQTPSQGPGPAFH